MNDSPMNATSNEALSPQKDLSGAVADLSGAIADLSGAPTATVEGIESEEPNQAAQIVSTATAAALPLLATLLGVVSPPLGFLMAIAAPAIVAGILNSSEAKDASENKEVAETADAEKADAEKADAETTVTKQE